MNVAGEGEFGRLSEEISVSQWNEMLAESISNGGERHLYIAEKRDARGRPHIRLFRSKDEVTNNAYELLSLDSICRLSDDILLRDRGPLIECNRNALRVRQYIQQLIDAKSAKVNSTATKVIRIAITVLKFILIGFFFSGVERKIREADFDVCIAELRNRTPDAFDALGLVVYTPEIIRRGAVRLEESCWSRYDIAKMLVESGERHPRPLEYLRAAAGQRDFPAIRKLAVQQGEELSGWVNEIRHEASSVRLQICVMILEAGFLIEASYRLHPGHFVQIKGEVIEAAPAGTSLSSLLTMFNAINMTTPGIPGYRYEGGLKDDEGVPVTREKLRTDLEALLKYIAGRVPYIGTPSASTPELVIQYYEDLEKMLKQIVSKLDVPTIDLDRKSSALIDLAVAAGHCGTRWKSEASAWCDVLTKKETDLSFPSRIMTNLQNFRLGILETIIREQRYTTGAIMNRPMWPHIQNHYLRAIGAEMALPGSDTTHEDPRYGLHGQPDTGLPLVTKEEARATFLSHYTTQAIIDNIDIAINGANDGSGKRINLSGKAFSRGEILNWFFTNVPENWRLDVYGTMKKALRDRIDEYKGYCEKTAFKGLMALHANKLISDHLLSFGLSGSGPIHLEQVEKMMHAKKWSESRIKNGMESIKAKIDEIGRVSEEASETEIDKYVKLIFKKVVLEDEYHLNVTNDPLNLTDVVKAIEEQRTQEYLATCVFDENGLVRRQALFYLLEKNNVLQR